MSPTPNPVSRSVAASLGVHALATALLLAAYLHAPSIAPLRAPGTPQGTRMLLTYSVAGNPQTGAENAQNIAPRPVPREKPALTAPFRSVPVPPASSDAGPAISGDSALGDEDVKIALPQFHPHPNPDLSSLPPGTSGSVVVDIVIDASGRVTHETLIKGLGTPIDNTVLATLQTWTFTPATKNGQVMPSQQEVLVHFDRGWAAPHIAPSPS